MSRESGRWPGEATYPNKTRASQPSETTIHKRLAIVGCAVILFLFGISVKQLLAQNVGTNIGMSPVPRIQFFNASGVPLAGGKLWTYAAGTSTQLNTWADASGTVPNPDPIVLDAGGFATIYLSTTQIYKFVLYDSLGNLIWSQDDVFIAGGSGGGGGGGGSIGNGSGPPPSGPCLLGNLYVDVTTPLVYMCEVVGSQVEFVQLLTPVSSGTTEPSTCTVDSWFWDTSTTDLFYCYTTNNWVEESRIMGVGRAGDRYYVTKFCAPNSICDSSVKDDTAKVSLTNESFDLGETNAIMFERPNDAIFGTVQYQLVTYTGIGGIATATIVSGGTGYSGGDVLTVVQAGGSGGTVKVTTQSGGVITGISVQTAGTGYAAASGLSTTGGAGSGATVTITIAPINHAVLPVAGTSTGIVGIAGPGAGKTADVAIAYEGTYPCAFDNSTVGGDTVTIASDGVHCHDNGTSGGGGQTLGNVSISSTAPPTGTSFVNLSGLGGSGGSSGGLNQVGAGPDNLYFSGWQNTPVTSANQPGPLIPIDAQHEAGTFAAGPVAIGPGGMMVQENFCSLTVAANGTGECDFTSPVHTGDWEVFTLASDFGNAWSTPAHDTLGNAITPSTGTPIVYSTATTTVAGSIVYTGSNCTGCGGIVVTAGPGILNPVVVTAIEYAGITAEDAQGTATIPNPSGTGTAALTASQANDIVVGGVFANNCCGNGPTSVSQISVNNGGIIASLSSYTNQNPSEITASGYLPTGTSYNFSASSSYNPAGNGATVMAVAFKTAGVGNLVGPVTFRRPTCFDFLILNQGGTGTCTGTIQVPSTNPFTGTLSTGALGTTSCTTANTAYATCTSVVTISPAQPDTNYSATCSGYSPNTVGARIVSVANTSTSTVTVTVGNGSASGAQAVNYGDIKCIAVHQ